MSRTKAPASAKVPTDGLWRARLQGILGKIHLSLSEFKDRLIECQKTGSDFPGATWLLAPDVELAAGYLLSHDLTPDAKELQQAWADLTNAKMLHAEFSFAASLERREQFVLSVAAAAGRMFDVTGDLLQLLDARPAEQETGNGGQKKRRSRELDHELLLAALHEHHKSGGETLGTSEILKLMKWGKDKSRLSRAMKKLFPDRGYNGYVQTYADQPIAGFRKFRDGEFAGNDAEFFRPTFPTGRDDRREKNS